MSAAHDVLTTLTHAVGKHMERHTKVNPAGLRAY
jgi:hypothetical protein